MGKFGCVVTLGVVFLFVFAVLVVGMGAPLLPLVP
jgi:hypothetical protein